MGGRLLGVGISGITWALLSPIYSDDQYLQQPLGAGSACLQGAQDQQPLKASQRGTTITAASQQVGDFRKHSDSHNPHG